MPHRPVYLNAMGIVCALGEGEDEVLPRLLAGDQSGMVLSDRFLVDGSQIPVGEVGNRDELHRLPLRHRSRNNLLLARAAEQIATDVELAKGQFGVDRIAVVMATSTSGIDRGEYALKYRKTHGTFPEDYDFMQQEISSPALFLAEYFSLESLTYTISTACSSGAKAFGSAKRLLDAELCDAVLVGGVDTLCGLTTNGFNSLSILSKAVSNPFSRNRAGINLGEGAALFLMTRGEGSVVLHSVGESSDAYDMTAPEPSGAGAELAMAQALHLAGLRPQEIDYINLHGTGTEQNDAMESAAIFRLFGDDVPCSSSKPQIGHTLGASGSVEAALCWLTLKSDDDQTKLPPHMWDGEADEGLLSETLVRVGQDKTALKYILSNSFAFGGSNASVILGRGAL